MILPLRVVPFIRALHQNGEENSVFWADHFEEITVRNDMIVTSKQTEATLSKPISHKIAIPFHLQLSRKTPIVDQRQ